MDTASSASGKTGGAKVPPVASLEETAGYKLEHCTYRRGVSIEPTELVQLYELLTDNPEEWNHRLRVMLAGMILYYISIGRFPLDVEATDVLPQKGTPHR